MCYHAFDCSPYSYMTLTCASSLQQKNNNTIHKHLSDEIWQTRQLFYVLSPSFSIKMTTHMKKEYEKNDDDDDTNKIINWGKSWW